jgi:hypothetical protein
MAEYNPYKRHPVFHGDIECDRHAIGLGSPENTASITKFEASLCVRYWVDIMWAAKMAWADRTYVGWEHEMYEYAGRRIDCFEQAGILTEEEIDALFQELDWDYVWATDHEMDEAELKAEQDGEELSAGIEAQERDDEARENGTNDLLDMEAIGCADCDEPI